MGKRDLFGQLRRQRIGKPAGMNGGRPQSHVIKVAQQFVPRRGHLPPGEHRLPVFCSDVGKAFEAVVDVQRSRRIVVLDDFLKQDCRLSGVTTELDEISRNAGETQHAARENGTC